MLRRVALAVFTAGFACYFVRMMSPGLESWFSADDLMNLYRAWIRPLPHLVASNIAVFVPYVRPLGQAYYLVIYSLFGFDPLAFNVVRLAMVALDVTLLFLFVSRALNSRAAAACALVLAGFQPALFPIYYDTGMIYDTLAFLFWVLTFWLYLRIRGRGEVPGWKALAGLLATFTCALNSKEIAVSLPVGVLLYELVLAPPRPERAAILAWLRREGQFAIAGGILTAFYLAARWFLPDSLYFGGGYRQTFSAGAYLLSYGTYLARFLGLRDPVPAGIVVAVLAGMIALAALTRRRVLIWASLFNLVAILPIAFIIPRGGFAFFVPLVPWLVLLSGLLVEAADRLARLRLLRPWPYSSDVLRAAVVALLAAVLIPYYITVGTLRTPAAQYHQVLIRTWYREVRWQLPTLPKGTYVLMLNGPPNIDWNIHFSLPLAFGERGLVVRTPSQLNGLRETMRLRDFAVVLDYKDSHFRVLRDEELEKLEARGGILSGI